jgi:hypothetical protein
MAGHALADDVTKEGKMTFMLDRRTRRNADIRDLTAAEFFADMFPVLAAANGDLVVEAVERLDAPPLTVEVGDLCWTVATNRGTLTASPGAVDDALVLTLTDEQFSDWAQDVRSLNSFTVAGELRHRNGRELDLSVWDALWRCLLDGWPVVGDLDFVDRDGRPLDFDRTFTPDDDPADVAHFLRDAGFLHLRGWVDAASMSAVSDEIDRAVPLYAEGDGRSWWARLADGSHVCVRLQQFVEHSPTTAAILESERWEQLRATLAAGDELVQGRPGTSVIEALIKPVGVVAGASDLSFHRDCHLGRHAYGCAGVDVGITVTASGPDNGQLQVVAGSHLVAIPVAVAISAPYLPVVGIATEPGDCTVHLSCTLHASTKPLVRTRKVMYSPFKLAPRADDVEPPRERSTALRERVSSMLMADGDEAGGQEVTR